MNMAFILNNYFSRCFYSGVRLSTLEKVSAISLSVFELSRLYFRLYFLPSLIPSPSLIPPSLLPIPISRLHSPPLCLRHIRHSQTSSVERISSPLRHRERLVTSFSFSVTSQMPFVCVTLSRYHRSIKTNNTHTHMHT